MAPKASGVPLNALLAQFVKAKPKIIYKPKQRLTLNYSQARKDAK